jgi:hypothetical protein
LNVVPAAFEMTDALGQLSAATPLLADAVAMGTRAMLPPNISIPVAVHA